MKKILSVLLLIGAMLATGATVTMAQAADKQVLLRFHTQHYDLHGAANSFQFVIGATENITIEVDCGFGSRKLEVGQATFDGSTGGITGTVFSGSVSEAGDVVIYGDASKIDYLDLAGLYITKLECDKLTNLNILNLEHNELLELDLSHMTKLQALYIDDNPFSVSPLVIGADKPDLEILSMSILGDLDPSFNFSDYPRLRSAIAWSIPSLTRCDVTGCPDLLQLSIDATNVAELDVTKNPSLMILNISETKITNIDLSKNLALTQFYDMHLGSFNQSYKTRGIDLSNNVELQTLFLSGNDLTDIDVSMLPKLTTLNLAHNNLTTINIDANPNIARLDISMNKMNFATIPANRPTFTEYYYTQQNFPVDWSYKVGTTLDFTEQAYRPGSQTYAVLYSVNRDNPEDVTLLDETYYTWKDCKMTLEKAYVDSVYVAFVNTDLPEAMLRTDLFMVKTAEEFGKDTPVATIGFGTTLKEVAFGVGMANATEDKPVKFNVDFGDGNIVECSATSATIPETPNVRGPRAGSVVTVYAPEGQLITGLGIQDQRVLSLNLDNASSLAYLTITGASMSSIALPWNNCLQSLDLSNNNFTTIDLTGANSGYGKNILTHINLSGNKLTAITAESNSAWIDLNLADNQFSTLSVLKASSLKRLNVKNNNLSTLDLRDCEELEALDVSNNNLTELRILDYVPLRQLNVSGNAFTFSALPSTAGIEEYVYAPQQGVTLPTKAPVVSLVNYLFTAEDGSNTVFEWHKATDDSVVPDGYITEENGRFFFSNVTDLGDVYCLMTHPAFPDFSGATAIRTSVVETADMPTNMFATFTPANSGVGRLSIAAKENGTTVYIDWSGEGEFEQYILADRYTVLEANTYAGKQVRCYSYGEDDGVTVFSLIGTPLLQADLSKMKSLINASFQNVRNGQENIVFPYGSEGLEELALYNCDITDINSIIAKFPRLRVLTTPGNPFVSADLSVAPTLQIFQSGGGKLENVTIDNPLLWDLSLSNNNISEIDLTKAPDIQQMWLSDNKIKSLDLTAQENLRALYIDGNCFTFETLPLPTFVVYDYAPQMWMEISAVDGKVDLSSQASVNGVATDYFWFVDDPYLDENGDLQGEQITEGEDYTIENGVTTFLKDFDNVMCVMTNATFPNLYLTTSYTKVDGVSGVENVTMADADAASVVVDGNRVVITATSGTPVSVYTVNGSMIGAAHGSATFGPLASGVYVARVGDKAIKLTIR